MWFELKIEILFIHFRNTTLPYFIFHLCIMKDQNCIFCKISTWEIPAARIREDENFLAILDAFPNRKWMTLVLPKEHYDSDVFSMEDDFLQKYMLAVKKVVNMLKKWLNVKKVWIIIEWEQVNHAHFRLYPFYDWWFGWNIWSGEKADSNQLNTLAEQIKNAN